MIDALTSLLKLQALDFNEAKTPEQEGEVTALRARVPQPILAHYDRLVARGKKGVAVVRNQVCTGCHMRLPIGTINTLMQDQDIQLCDTCGRYLYLLSPAEEAPAAAPADAAPAAKPATKPAAKPRKRKVAANATV
jgi:predicted  nucleic acid-binding Zn-ribbon protein